MNIKEKVMAIMQSLGDNATIDEVIDRLYLIRKIEIGLAQVEAGDVTPHEEFMAELDREEAQ